MSYRTVAREECARITVGKSIFIARVRETADETSVRNLLAEARVSEPQADHYCYAYRILAGRTTTTHSNDGGEPGGSAGRPILEAIVAAGLTNTAVVVTRYFGGKKLGLPRLSAAYRSAAALALARAGTVERIPKCRLCLRLEYPQLEQARWLLRQYGAEEKTARYEQDVVLTAEVPLSFRDELATALILLGVMVRAAP